MEKIVDAKLKNYIENNILPEYKLNDLGHNIEHVNFVLERAYEISEAYDISYDMLYTIVCFHDIACHINREEHEILSAKKLYDDKFLNKFFDTKDLTTMKEAVEDHRASLEYVPRNIYGKILSSADRKIGVDNYLHASIGFSIKKNPRLTDEELIEDSYKFAIKKFGKEGYAVKKIYVKDKKYEEFLQEIQYLIDNKEEFVKRAQNKIKELKRIKKNNCCLNYRIFVLLC